MQGPARVKEMTPTLSEHTEDDETSMESATLSPEVELAVGM
jgi:hypothetical protein